MSLFRFGPINSLIEYWAKRKIIKELIPELRKLRKYLVELQEQLKPLGNYRLDLVTGDVSLTDMPIRELETFFHAIDAVNVIMKKLSKDFNYYQLPQHMHEEYLSLWFMLDSAANGGTHNINYDYQRERGNKKCVVSNDNIYLGSLEHYDLWRKSVTWILERWPFNNSKLKLGERYSCQAWGFIYRYSHDLIEKISELECKLGVATMY